MSENKNNLPENISVEEHSADNVAFGETIDLEKLGEGLQEEKISKGKYNGKLPLVKSSKEAKKFMSGLLADEARAAGADALVSGATIKQQYNTMKRLAYWLIGLGVASSAISDYIIYDQYNQLEDSKVRLQRQDEEYEALLRQTVSALPKEQIQYARSVYAGAIIDHMNKNPDMGVLDATRRAVQSVNAEEKHHILPALKRVISSDVMTMAKAYENMGVSKVNYHNVMVGYAKNVVNAYTSHTTEQTTVKNNILYYLQSAHMR